MHHVFLHRSVELLWSLSWDASLSCLLITSCFHHIQLALLCFKEPLCCGVHDAEKSLQWFRQNSIIFVSESQIFFLKGKSFNRDKHQTGVKMEIEHSFRHFLSCFDENDCNKLIQLWMLLNIIPLVCTVVHVCVCVCKSMVARAQVERIRKLISSDIITTHQYDSSIHIKSGHFLSAD